MDEKNVEHGSLSYSEMLLELVAKFEEELPLDLTFEDTIEIGIDAWNLANRKDFLLDKELYKQELKSGKHSVVIDRMVNYKIEKFDEARNMIADYIITDNVLKVETRSQEAFFDNLVNQMINFDESE